MPEDEIKGRIDQQTIGRSSVDFKSRWKIFHTHRLYLDPRFKGFIKSMA